MYTVLVLFNTWCACTLYILIYHVSITNGTITMYKYIQTCMFVCVDNNIVGKEEKPDYKRRRVEDTRPKTPPSNPMPPKGTCSIWYIHGVYHV